MSSALQYDVFVSHAGEDKATIAIPLRNMLRERGVIAFVDERDIQAGEDATEAMVSAMDAADIAVIVLSPEYVAKKWPMRELLFFLSRRDEALPREELFPILIPVFYRLNVEDMYHEPRLERKTANGKSLYGATRFFQRMDDGEPEADVEIIRRALRTVHGIMGVENKSGACNDESSAPSRLLLLQQICNKVSQVLPNRAKEPVSTEQGNGSSSIPVAFGDMFERYFHQERLDDVVLDFDSTQKSYESSTYEARIKHHILNCDGSSEPGKVVAILGSGGVGKSTILKGLANDEDLRKRFRDGIHLISMGMDTTLVKVFRRVCQLLRDSGALDIVRRLWKEKDTNPPIDEAIHEATSWFRGKRCAFLIDDVWTNNFEIGLFENLLKLSNADQHSIVVFTTREHEIAAVASLGRIFHISPRDEQGPESRGILFFHSGLTESKVCTEDAKKGIVEVLNICGGLPVALAVAGRSLKMLAIDKGTDMRNICNDYLMSLRNHREQLLVRNIGDYVNLYTTFGASITLLEKRKEEKLGFKAKLSFGEMHRRLCVLQKQSQVPASTLRHLWELQSNDQAKLVALRFVEICLAHSIFSNGPANHFSNGSYSNVVTRTWRLGIHDSLHDYAAAEAKRHGEVVLAHKALLKGYRHSLPSMVSTRGVWSKWWSGLLKDDKYIHTNLYHHLIAVGRAWEVNKLMCRNEWIERLAHVRRRVVVNATRLRCVALAVIAVLRILRSTTSSSGEVFFQQPDVVEGRTRTLFRTLYDKCPCIGPLPDE